MRSRFKRTRSAPAQLLPPGPVAFAQSLDLEEGERRERIGHRQARSGRKRADIEGFRRRERVEADPLPFAEVVDPEIGYYDEIGPRSRAQQRSIERFFST